MERLRLLIVACIAVMFIMFDFTQIHAGLFYIASESKDPPSIGEHAELEKDKDVLAARKSWLIARYNREIQKIQEGRLIIIWTNRIGYAIFIVVHLILSLAIWASLHEFIHAKLTRKKEEDQHEFKISFDGIALRTSMHGTVLLLIAIVFYYLFLKFVFPVTVVNYGTIEKQEAKGFRFLDVPQGSAK